MPEESAPLPHPLSKKLELVHSFTIIFVLGDVIVFIIKLHYSSAIAVCACFISLTLSTSLTLMSASCVVVVLPFPSIFFRSGVTLDETEVLARCILKPSRREDT